MKCAKQEIKNQWNENMECFQKVPLCNINSKACKGTEDVCSLFEKGQEPVKPTEPAKPDKPKEPAKEDQPAA